MPHILGSKAGGSRWICDNQWDPPRPSQIRCYSENYSKPDGKSIAIAGSEFV
jgi:hypothetical protein